MSTYESMSLLLAFVFIIMSVVIGSAVLFVFVLGMLFGSFFPRINDIVTENFKI